MSYNQGSSNLDLDPKEALAFIIERQVKLLFKEYLRLHEDNIAAHDEGLGKLYESLPAEYQSFVSLADWMTDERAERVRSEILRRGNDTIRSITREMDKFDIDFRQ